MSRRIEAIRSGLVRFRRQALPGLCQLYDLHYDWTRFWGAGQLFDGTAPAGVRTLAERGVMESRVPFGPDAFSLGAHPPPPEQPSSRSDAASRQSRKSAAGGPGTPVVADQHGMENH